MIVIDDFVSDRALLQRVAADATFFASNGTYMWWDGWWRGSANTLKRELIEYIWREHCPCDAVTAAGFEYWTGRYAGDDQHPSTLDLHVEQG